MKNSYGSADDRHAVHTHLYIRTYIYVYIYMMKSKEEDDDDVRFHDKVIRLERKCRYSSDVKSASCVSYMLSLRDLCNSVSEKTSSSSSKNAPASVGLH